MAKTAAQLVPLKTQLNANMALFRFADAFTDFQSSLAYQPQPYDNAGAPLVVNGTSGVPAFSGTAVTATPLGTPTGFSISTNQSFSTTTGLSSYLVKPTYHIVYIDSSNREGTAMVVQPTIPAGTTVGSVTFNFTYPAGVSKVRIYKVNTTGQNWYRAELLTTVGTYVDNNNTGGSLQGGTGITITYSTGHGIQPSPDGSSTAPPVTAADCVITTSSAGGSFRSPGYGYALSAFNALGETLVSAESVASVNGSPVISGSTMGTVSLASSTAAGTIPAGKHYYKVTAYTQRLYDVVPAMQAGYPGPTGAGGPESLPSAEVNITTSATGQVQLTWATVTNAQGYVIYRSRDLVAPTVTSPPTTATTGGTLPASTAYFYVVTATNANGETIASNEVTVTTGAGTSTNTISLAWAQVPYAFGYKVYRGTVTGTENALLTTITSGGTLTYTDTGTAGSAATPPGTNTATGVGQETYLNAVTSGAATGYTDANQTNGSGTNGNLRPPAQYNGVLTYVSVTPSWSAVSGAVGYNLYRNVAGLAAQGNNCNYYNLGAVTTYTDTAAAATGNLYPPQVNFSGSNNICTVGRYVVVKNDGVSTPYIDKLGFTFTPVSGKQYRIGIYDQSNTTQRYVSSYFTAQSGATQYFEVNPNISLNVNSSNYFFVQGADSTSTISWGPNTKTTTDYPFTVSTDNNTWIAAAPNYNISSGSQLGISTQRGQYPTQVFTEATAGLFPMKLSVRTNVSGTSINGTRGTFLGGVRAPQFAYSANVTYTTPIKSIVPSWSLLTPTTLSGNAILLAGKWVTVEVSTDAGTTWTAVQNQVRYVFPSAATQLQWRYTVPESSAKMSFDRRLTTNLPADGNNLVVNNSYYLDTSQQGYFYQISNNSGDMYLYSNGNMLMGNQQNDWRYHLYAILSLGHDIDMTVVGYNNQGGNFGIKFANNGQAGGGYYFYLDNSGGCGLLHQPDGTISNTTLATVTGVASSALNVSHALRVIYINNHILCFVDGRLVIDTTDSGRVSASYNCHGVAGNRGVIQSISMTNLTNPANTPQWELEYVNAYLET